MKFIEWLIPAALVGCAASADSVDVDPDEVSSDLSSTQAEIAARAIPDVSCAGDPDAGPRGTFRHFGSTLLSALAAPQHRGFDLVASAEAATQQLEGWIKYGLGTALGDEDVDLFACRAGAWQRAGTTRTDSDGHFSLGLSGASRLAVGTRDLFVSVVGDRSGVRFLGEVAPAGTQLVISDVDGTLTSSENAFIATILLGIEPDAQAGAAQVFGAAQAAGRQLVYVTARADQYTTATRDWLEHKGFPRGALRLSPQTLTASDATIDYKTRAIAALSAAGFALSAGVGNRATDVAAYTATGIAAGRIFIKLPEFQSEVQPALDAHQAVGIAEYSELTGKL